MFFHVSFSIDSKNIDQNIQTQEQVHLTVQ